MCKWQSGMQGKENYVWFMHSHHFEKQLMLKSRSTCTYEKRIQHLKAYLFRNVFILKHENFKWQKTSNPRKEWLNLFVVYTLTCWFPYKHIKYRANPPHQDDLYITGNCGLWHKYIFSISVPCNKYSVIKTSYTMNTENYLATKLIPHYRQCLWYEHHCTYSCFIFHYFISTTLFYWICWTLFGVGSIVILIVHEIILAFLY